MEVHESYGDISALEADIVKLSERLASAYRAKARCNDDANFERRRAVSAEAEVARLTEALTEAARIGWEYGRTSWCPAGILFDKDRTERDWRRAKAELNPSLAALKESTTLPLEQ